MTDDRIIISSGPIEIGEEQGVAPDRVRHPADVVLLSGQPMFHNELGDKVSKRFIIDLETAFYADVINGNYDHDPKEQVGIGENIRIENGQLVCDGWIVPFRPKDRAEEIIFRSQQGTRFEASIEFPPLEPEVEEIAADEPVTVNGFDLIGPIRVYRYVPIRAWAVSPTGNDSGTKVTVLNQKLESLTDMKKTTPKSTTKPQLVKLNEDESQQTEETTTTSAHPDLDELISLFGQEIGLTMYQDGVDIDLARQVAEFNEKYGIVAVPAGDAPEGELSEENATEEKEDEKPKSETAELRADNVKLTAQLNKLTGQLNKLTAQLTRTGEADGVTSGHSAQPQKQLSEKEQFFANFAKFSK